MYIYDVVYPLCDVYPYNGFLSGHVPVYLFLHSSVWFVLPSLLQFNFSSYFSAALSAFSPSHFLFIHSFSYSFICLHSVCSLHSKSLFGQLSFVIPLTPPKPHNLHSFLLYLCQYACNF